MRILLLAPEPFYESRGTPIAVRACLEGLARLGHAVDVVTYFDGMDVPLPAHVTLHRIDRPPLVKHVPIGVSWQKIPCDWNLYRLAARMLRRHHYDLIHAVEEASFIARWLSRRSGVPYVFDMDSMMSGQIIEKSLLFWPVSVVFGMLERGAIGHAAGVLAVCPLIAEYARRCHPHGPVVLLPDLPVHEEPSDVAPDPHLPATSGAVRLVYVGNLEAYQGIDLLLEAWSMVVSGDDVDAELLIVGGSPRHVAAYQAKASKMGRAGQRIHFLGPRPLEMLPAVLRAADILLSPRIKGVNTPMKIYNYMQAGRAIVATRMPTHTQVLSDDCACLVEPTAAALAAGLKRVIGDAGYRQRLGAAALELLEKEFSEARWNERLASFYAVLSLVLPAISDT